MNDTHDTHTPQQPARGAQPEAPKPEVPKPRKRHAIRPRWLRIMLKTLMWLVIVVLCLPVLIYIPPVQDLAISIARDAVRKSTGMEIGIGKFRLSFPLKVHLKDVYVLTAPRDTMVRAGEAIADIKLLPLLNLDVKVNRLDLENGFYRMVNADSSMILGIRAGHLTVDDKSSVDIKKSRILLNKVRLSDGDLSLYMDVWKKKPTPPDTVPATPFYIQANDVTLDNFRFGMSMLPTIDTLSLDIKRVALTHGIVDLGKNEVKWKRAAMSNGSVIYLQPTPEYIKTHPAPPSEPSEGPPMRIMGDSIAVDSLKALYATKGVKPAAGFDPSYIAVDGVGIGMRNFYNEASTVRLPLTRLRAQERSGLQITQGRGTIGVDSIGLTLKQVNLQTLFSRINADADVPFAVMAMEPDAPMNVKANGSVGLPDVEAFMPTLKTFTAKIPSRKPLRFDLDARGSLSELNVGTLKATMDGVVRIDARGHVANALQYKKLRADIEFDGALMDPRLARQFLAQSDMQIPAFDIKGTARADGLQYGADFTLRSTAGDVAANGHVALTPETYNVDASIHELNVAQFMPSLGIGRVTGTVQAGGQGFNPVSGHAVTDAKVHIDGIEYKKYFYRDIRLDAVLDGDGRLTVAGGSVNPGLNFGIDGSGTIRTDDYDVDLRADIRDLDLRQLGFTDSLCQGSGTIFLAGNARPGKWLYDVDLKLVDFDWNMPGTYIHLPGGLHAVLKADELATMFDVDSDLTDLHFESPAGMKYVMDSFIAAADTVTGQINRRNISVADIKHALPQFKLDVNASGRGLVSQFLAPSGISVDTIWGHIERDSIITGNFNLHRLSTSVANADTVTLNLNERGSLLDYRIHMGNRPGTFDEFAQANVNGYLGQNRLGMFFNQRNIKNQQGYRIGLTASLMDSVVNVHFTPLKSTIAYLPWTLNNDNYIAYNLHNMHVDANLKAQSKESSILARTETNDNGNEQFRLKVDNLHIEDFLGMSITAPPVKGSVNTDLTVLYVDEQFHASGGLQLNDFIYERKRVGSFDFDINAAYATQTGRILGDASLKIDGHKAIRAFARVGTSGASRDSIGVLLNRFPLRIANPFLGQNARLSGYLNGAMRLDSTLSSPIFNGRLAMDSASVYIPMAAASLKMDTARITVRDNVLRFNQFDIWGANKNPLSIDGTIDASDFRKILVDLTADARNMQLIKSDKRSKGDIFGKIYLDLGLKVKGPLQRLDVSGNLNLLGNTDATYRLNLPESEFTATNDEGVVKFVNFSDTTQVARKDSIEPSLFNMKLDANVVISPGTHLQVLLSTNGTDKLELQPSANLNFHQSFMGDMTMYGTVTLGTGFVRYAFPVLGEKMFDFNPESTITWNGALMNPTLNITATDNMKANITQGGNSRLANFLVTARVTNPLDQMKVSFDLSTNDDLTIQNELQSMSPDQRQTQAMNLLIYGQYTGQGGTKGNANIGGNMLYSFLESQLNSWAAKHVRGVELSFGIDQYEKASNGAKTTETNYSYQVSKSLFNNRFKILVGGNYSTDQNPEDNLAQNLISDISFEYMIKQTQSMNMSVQLFRHQGFESILEGEITETGVAFVMRRKLANLRNFFRFRRRKKPTTATVVIDSTAESHGVPTQNALMPPKFEAVKKGSTVGKDSINE